MRSAILLGFLCALLVVLPTRRACAADALSREARVMLAWSLEDLSRDDRALLAAAATLAPGDCRGGGAPCALAADHPTWHDDLREIAIRLAGNGGWQAAVLAELLDPRLASSPYSRTLKSFTERLAAALGNAKDAKCDALRKNLRSYATSYDTVDSLDPSYACFGETMAAFVGAPPDAAREAALDDASILAVRLAPGERLQAVALLRDGDPWMVDDATQTTLPGEGNAPGASVGLLVVPKHARLTTRISGPGRRLSEVRTTDFSNPDLYPNPNEYLPRFGAGTSCFGWSLAPRDDDGREVFFDGEPMTDSTIAVPQWGGEGDVEVHDLVVMKRGNEPQVLAHLKIPHGQLPRTGCRIVPLDLTPTDDRRDVAILSATADPACLASGVDSQMLRTRVERFLADSGRTPRDTSGLAETVTGFAALAAQLSALGEAPAGASRERLDSRSRLGVGAAETLRHGFDSLLTVHLSCAPAGGSFDFALRATRVTLDKLAGTRDPSAGIDVQDATDTKVEVFHGAESLDDSTVAVLSQTFGAPQVRMDAERGREAFHGHIEQRVRVFIPVEKGRPLETDGEGYDLQLELRHMNASEAYSTCSLLDGVGRLRDQTPPQSAWDSLKSTRVDFVSRPVDPQRGSEASYSIAWFPYMPGWYLLRTELRRGEAPVPGSAVAYRCVEAFDSGLKLEIAASYSVNVMPPIVNPGARTENLGFTQFTAFASHASAEDSGLFIGVALGYANAVHSRNAPPSWQLPGPGAGGGPAYDAGGTLPLTWTRQSVQIGPVFSYYASAPACFFRIECERVPRGLGLLARFVPVLDIGVIDTSGIPPQLQQLVSSGRNANFEASAFVQTGVTARLDQEKEFHVLFNLGLLSWGDLLPGNNQRAALQSLTYDENVTVGVTLGGEWEP